MYSLIDREDFVRPLWGSLERVDQEAYCDHTQPPVLRRPRTKKVKPVGEQADYELDAMLAGPLWDSDGWEDYNDIPPPQRSGFKAPDVQLATCDDFQVIPRHTEGYHSIEAPLAPREMEVLEWAP